MSAKPTTPPSTTELRAAFERAKLLHFYGRTFERAIAVPTLAWALEKSALATRQKNNLPAQPRLI